MDFLLSKGEACVQYPLQPAGIAAWVLCLPRTTLAFLLPSGCTRSLRADLALPGSSLFSLQFLLQSGTTSAELEERALTWLTHH